MLEQYFKLRRCRRRDDAPWIGQGRRVRQAADAIPAQGFGAAVAGSHMNIMWRRNSPTPRNCSRRDGAATYPRPTHKNGSRRSVTRTSAARRSIPAPKVDRRRPHQHPDPGRHRDRRPSAASTRRKAAPSTSRPTRTLTPSGRAISMRDRPPRTQPHPRQDREPRRLSTGRKCAAVSAGAGRPCRSSRHAHQPNVLRDNPCSRAVLPAALAEVAPVFRTDGEERVPLL